MTDIAEAANPEANEVLEIAKPLTLEEARASRMSKQTQGSNTEDSDKTEELEAEAPEVPEVEEPEAEVEDAVDEEEEVLSQTDEIDVDSLTEEDVYALAKLKGIDIENPKSSKAWAEQRKEIKILKEQIDSVQKEKDELLAIAPVSDNPFANLRDVESIENAVKQAEVNAEYWNEQLILNQETQYDDDSGKDIRGITHEGRFYPASEVLNFVKAERAKIGTLNERKLEVGKQSELFANQGEQVESFKSSLGLEGETASNYEEMLKSPKFALVKSLVPEYGAELVELLAHAARSKAEGVLKKPVIKRKSPAAVGEKLDLGSTGRTSSNSPKGREAALDKIVNGAGHNYQQKMAAMRELRLLRTKQ